MATVRCVCFIRSNGRHIPFQEHVDLNRRGKKQTQISSLPPPRGASAQRGPWPSYS